MSTNNREFDFFALMASLEAHMMMSLRLLATCREPLRKQKPKSSAKKI